MARRPVGLVPAVLVFGLGLGSAAEAEETAGVPVGTRVVLRRPVPLTVAGKLVEPATSHLLFTVKGVKGPWVGLDLAGGVFDAALRQRPDAWTYIQRAIIFADKSDFDAAMGVIDMAERADPKSPWPHQLRGDVWVARKQDARAVAAFSEAIRLDPAIIEGWVQRGGCRARMKDHEGAIADLREAVRLDPTNPIAHLAG